MSAPATAAAAIDRQARDISRCMGRRGERVNGPGYDRLGVIGIVAMLVHATGAPAFSAACSGGSVGSQCTPRNRRPVTFPAASETSQRRGGAMTSGWIILVRSKPDFGGHRRVRYAARDQDVNGHSSTVQVFRHDGAKCLECGLGWPVGRGAGVQHRAQAGRDIDDAAPALAHHVGHDRVRQREWRRRVNRDKAAPLIRRDLPEFEGALPTIWTDCSRADAGIVDEDVDAAQPIAGGFGDLLGRGVASQIRLDGEEFGPLSLLTRARRKRSQRLSIAIDTGDPDARRQQAPHHRPADTACRTGYDRHSLGFGHRWFLPCCPGLSYFGLERRQ